MSVLRRLLAQSDSLSLTPPARASSVPTSGSRSFRPSAERCARILHAARDPARASDISSLLAVDEYSLRSVYGLEQLFEAILAFAPEVLLVDDDFHDLDVAVLCSQIHVMTMVHRPRIVFLCAGEPEEEAAASALLAGVEDYVSAERGTELRARIRVALRRSGQFLTLARLRRERNELQSIALLDGLTGVPNRRAFDVKLETLVEQREGFSVLFVDLDHFKLINDHFGHAVGDVVLRCVARVLKECLRPGDFLCRYGGEEFVILTRTAAREELGSFAERLRDRVVRLTFSGAEHLNVTISVGADTLESQSSDSASKILASADASLYQAKRSGRNRTVVAGEPYRRGSWASDSMAAV